MRRGATVFVVGLAVTLCGALEGTSQAQGLKEGAEGRLTIEAAVVSTEDQAKKIALDAFTKRMGGKRGLQTAKVVSVHELDVDIKGFAKKGHKVWEVRIVGLRRLNAIIWVHSETAQTLFLVPSE
jgi:hypothetical protein